ncbi:hypothetical protein HRbin36_01852 [bacterium HR36]|nr:hypothetical protein HRbin36_01852 [bacterium HR36]
MLQRTTFNNLVNRSIHHLQATLRELERLHTQAVTGKKWTRPSQNPVGFSTAQSYHGTLDQLEALGSNLTDMRLSLETSSQALQQISAIVNQARALAAEGAHGSPDETSQRALAAQVNGLLEQVLSLANSRTPDHYVFAGTAATKQPFQALRNAQGRIVAVRYVGNDEAGTAHVGQNEWVQFLYAGRDVFQGQDSSQGEVVGNTGLALGTGTSRVRGRIAVEVRHTATLYAPGSGVAPGNSSASGDTILGPSGANTLFLQDTSGTGTSGTVSLNGGPAIAWTNTDTDLQVVGPNGEVVFIDTTNITPGFSGTVAITANGELSLDGGSTILPLAFSTNQYVTDARGNVVFFDTSQVRRVGVNWVEFPGGYDIFSALLDLRDDLENARQLTAGQQTEALSRMMASLDTVHDALLQTLGDQSATLAQLETLEQHMQEMKLDLQSRLGKLEQADLAELVVQLQAQQNQLTLVLGATAALMQTSLLDFLR